MMTRALRVLVALLAVLVLGAGMPQSKSSKKKVDPNKLGSALKSKRTEKKQVQQKLRQNKVEQRKVKKTLESIDNRLDTLNDSLADTAQRLASSREDQKRLEGESAVALSRLQERREQARRRLRQLYIRGNASLATAFVGAQSMGDLASRSFLFRRITQRDRSLFDEVKQLHRKVLEQKQQADRLVVRVNNLLVSQKQQESDLTEARRDKKVALVQLQSSRSELEKILAELESEERAIASSLAAYYASRGKTTGLKFSGRLAMPVKGRLSSRFGMRKHPILRIVRLHAGQDIAAKSGTPIHAAADGIVISASYMRGYGNCLIIDHGGGISTLYGHCSRLIARAGQRVKRGETVANVGSTGLASGPHLHFEVRVNGKPVNPTSWL